MLVQDFIKYTSDNNLQLSDQQLNQLHRYQELLKELWKSQSKLDEFGFSEEEKKILNDRVKIWLEYFAITSAFRDENVNLFEYIDSFTETQKFI